MVGASGIIKELAYNRKLAYAYLTSQRLFLNYKYYTEQISDGESLILKNALDYIFIELFNDNHNINEIEYYIEDLKKVIPPDEDDENFDIGEDFLINSALDSCSIIIATLRFMDNKNFEEIGIVESIAYNTVYMYLMASLEIDPNEDPEYLKKINANVLMVDEINNNKRIIEYLAEETKFDELDIDVLRRMQKDYRGSLNLYNLK